MTTRHIMTARQLLALAGLVAAALLLAVTPASASSYRYWSFWQGSGSGWSYQESGPNGYVPADGSVDGWRFGVSADSAAAEKPRTAPDFAAACANTPAVSGKKRVEVVIDYGTTADAGSGAVPPAVVSRCVTLAPDASSAQLLAQAAPPLRYDSNGMLCSISGYPQSGCGEVVSGSAGTVSSTASASAAPTVHKPSKSTKTAGWVVGAAIIAVLAGASYWQSRRRRG